MKWYWSILFSLVLLVTSCQKGEIYNADKIRNRGSWFEPSPFGMVYVQRGSFHIGPSDDELFEHNRTRTISVDAFWIDDTEITNSEYRQFVHWVRDSIARQILGQVYPEFMITQDMYGNPLQQPVINWRQRIDWRSEDIRTVLDELYLPEHERFAYKREVDTRKLVYDYYWLDLQQASRRANSYNFETQSYTGTVINLEGEEVPIENRSAFIMHETVPIYPDTLCWIRDFTYSYNEPLTYQYFAHVGFDDYPVVGVNWNQARAFCNWRTQLQATFRSRMNDTPAHDYRLPTESEWELAARGGHQQSIYAWGSYYTRNNQGCFMANFKPLRGNYVADSDTRVTTMKVGSFDPNDYGIYDMAGNVAEWTSSAYFESGYDIINDLNPEVAYFSRPGEAEVMKRKVTRGGSFKDAAYFIRNSTRSFEYQDTTKSYVGFRCVRSSFRNELQNR